MIGINRTNLYLDFPALMVADNIKENKYNHKKSLKRMLKLHNINVEVRLIDKYEVLGSAKSGVKLDREIPSDCNFAIINRDIIVPIKKIRNSVVYFDNLYKVTDFIPFCINTNLYPLKFKDNKIYFQDCKYEDIDIEAKYINLLKIRFTVKDV